MIEHKEDIEWLLPMKWCAGEREVCFLMKYGLGLYDVNTHKMDFTSSKL